MSSKRKTYCNFFLYLLLLNLLLFGSCHQEDDHFTLPPITQTGENTFGCIIDGRVMIPRDGKGTFGMEDNAILFIGTETRNYNEIQVHDYASKRTSGIVLHIENLNNIGEYIVNESSCQEGADSPITTNIFCRVYDHDEKIYKRYCSYTNSGTIRITRFEFDQFIAGEFSCYLKNVNDSSDKIEIRQGRFDLGLETLRRTKFP